MEIIHEKGTKIYDLSEKIKQNKKLKDLLFDYRHETYSWNLYQIKGFTHLHHCVYKSIKFPTLCEYIDEYLNLYPDEIDLKNEIGDTPLIMISQELKCENMIHLLLKHHANVNAINLNHSTALMYAVENNQIEAVKLLLEHGAHVNFRNKNEETPLHIASQYGMKEIIKMLLEYGAYVNFYEDDFNTPLMYAVKGSYKNVKKIIQYGANVNIKNQFNEHALIITLDAEDSIIENHQALSR